MPSCWIRKKTMCELESKFKEENSLVIPIMKNQDGASGVAARGEE